MLKDPAMRWPGGFPYDHLAAAGITPEASMEAVREASFVLMARGALDAEARRAWDALRRTRQRLVVDFFLYDLELGLPEPMATAMRRAFRPLELPESGARSR